MSSFHGACQRGGRFSANARTPSQKSSLWKQASRSATSSRLDLGVELPLGGEQLA